MSDLVRDGDEMVPCTCVEWSNPVTGRVERITWCKGHRQKSATGCLTPMLKQKVFEGLLPYLKTFQENKHK